MATLRDILRRINSVKSTRQITKAMKMVAAAQLRKAQLQAEQSRPYAEKMSDMLGHLSAVATDKLSHPYFEKREVEKQTLVVMTSDRGLCGAFNSNLIRNAEHWLKERDPEKVELVCVGRRGYQYFKKREWKIVEAYIEFNAEMKFDMVRGMVNQLTTRFVTGQTDEIYLLYAKFFTTAKNVPTFEKYLNIDKPESHGDGETVGAYIFEPTPDDIFSALLPRYALIRLQSALADSFASEHATRMMAMTLATNNAGEMIDSLTLQYNKARQASITTEILEVVSGAEALRG
ncbi:MAG: ATP synthase F1 subunit gamma [candidate division Zixibacteria bacterium]|nr:ATP synthase F1 subunit gamma [candidate division Zixibacteria bacterium]